MIDPVALSQALVRCPSVTPEDAGAQRVLADALTPLGFSCETLQYGDVKNLFARLGPQKPETNGPHLCFCGHTDVVPPGDEKNWRHPPFSAAVEDGKLYGRGTADMKCNIACFAAAVAAFVDRHGPPPGAVSFLITGDEEALAVDGTVKVLEWLAARGEIPDAALVGEPSNPDRLGDEIKIGRRGSLSGGITVRGRQGHTAYPDRADNPLPRLVKLLDALAGHEFDKGSAFFPPTNLQLTTIDTGNRADNVIPEKAAARFNARFNDKWTARTLEAEIRAVLDAVSGDYTLEAASNAESFLTAPGPFTALVADAVREVTGRTPRLATGGGTSDARFVSRYCPVVECGLVNRTIHQTDEHVEIADIHRLTEIYGAILERFFYPVAG